MIDVFILEDDQVTLEHLVDKVDASPDLRVIGTANNLQKATAELRHITPNVLLVDLQLPDGDSFELIQTYSDKYPDRPILVISVFGDEQRVVKAISAGAKGYLLKDDTKANIAAALTAVTEGQSPISPAIAVYLVKHFQRTHPSYEIENPLSERELEVLKLAAKGLTYREVSSALNVSVSTVGTYTMRIYTKLAVNSRAEAVYEARKLGLMED